MPVTIERLCPSDMAPIGAFRERRLRRGVIGDRGATIEIGLVNNMPDAAMPATERQFANLLAAASDRFEVPLHLLPLDAVPPSQEARPEIPRTPRDPAQP